MATKFRLKFVLLLLAAVLLLSGMYFWSSKKSTKITSISNVGGGEKTLSSPSELPKVVHIAVVSCGESRLNQTAQMIKSALTFASVPLHFHIFTDSTPKSLQSDIDQMVDSQSLLKSRLRYNFYPIELPVGEESVWQQLFKPCASQRLFLPSALSRLDAFIYVDCDVLFLAPPEQLWMKFGRFSRTQSISFSLEAEESKISWYSRFAQHPYYPPSGLNSGVMLINLTRFNRVGSKWSSRTAMQIYQKYKSTITWGDQDIFNIFFHFHPEMVAPLGCEWNFRPDHCGLSRCQTALDGRNVRLLHGSRESFLNGRQPTFMAIFRAFQQFRLGEDLHRKLLGPMEMRLSRLSGGNFPCQLDFLAIPTAISQRLSANLSISD